MQGGLFSDRGIVWLVENRGSSHPWLVMAEGEETVALTGWCKTRDYCETKISQAVVEGYGYGGLIVLQEASRSDLIRLRLSPFQPADLKSALQKYVRRGMVAEAANVAYTLAGTSEGESWLRRRIPIIAAEDVGWCYLPLLGWGMDTVRTAATLAARVKKPEAAAVVMAVSPMVWDEELFSADDVETCLRLIVGASQRKNAFELGVDKKILHVAIDMGHADLVGVALGRAKSGGMTDDVSMLLVSAFLLAVEGAVVHDPWVEEHPLPQVVERLDWWTQDLHTGTGKRALARVARRKGLSAEKLGRAMFVAESLRMDRIAEVRWDADRAFAEWAGFATREQVEVFWNEHASDVAEAIESLLP